MLSVILTILKIIGLVLLSIVGLIILILILILFVPIRYRINASKPDESNQVTVAGKVTWLLHLINLHIDYPSDEMIRFRIGVFKVFPRKNEISDKSHSKKEKNKRKTDIAESQFDRADDEEEEKVVFADEVINEASDICENLIDENAPEEEKASLKSFVSKIFSFLRNFKEKVVSIGEKIKKVLMNIKHFIDVFESNKFQIGFKKCRQLIFKLLKRFVPKTIKGYIHFGFDDPYTTGSVLGYYSLIFPFIGPKLKVLPDFESKVIDFDVIISGRFILFNVLITALKVYFDKDIKRFISIIKKEFLNG